MPGMRSSAATKCISDVPGLQKQVSTPLFSSVCTRLSAPFIPIRLPFVFLPSYGSVTRRRTVASAGQAIDPAAPVAGWSPPNIRGSAMIIHAGPLTDLLAAILARAGAEPERARICAEHLVSANLKGHDSHGVGMAPSYVRWIAAGKLKPNARPTVVSDKGAVIVVDGGFGLGAPVAREAVAMAIERARAHGVCCLALRNSCHIGRIGTYGEQC